MTVRVDGNSFERCIFRNCVLEFGGTGEVRLVECEFYDSRWSFVGPAATTIQFMTGLYHGLGPEGQRLIEQTFAEIRGGPSIELTPDTDE